MWRKQEVVYDSTSRVYGTGCCVRMFPPFPVPRSAAGCPVFGQGHLSPSRPAKAAAETSLKSTSPPAFAASAGRGRNLPSGALALLSRYGLGEFDYVP
ncbi:hypothetical protein TREES_T100003247 [Tupaia chinensis]|uniref:Uncharacterized protein n=1 Tax=Tupaia chinensis TaxID=246437 RepID=L9JPC5_TUPCH|nr:hypothetical protein TREES_T100003247 [Tupaia chinensis]